MKYIINDTGIVLFRNGKPQKFASNEKSYAAIIAALKLPEDQQEKAIDLALEQSNVNADIASIGFMINHTTQQVAYKGELLPLPLAQKVFSLIKENLPVTLLEKFWENLKLNPSYNSIRELYDFLSYKELPITEDGCFLAYRGLQDDFYSVRGNLQTKVLQGKVNKLGQIYNGVGEHIEVCRGDVDDNRDNTCSQGVHAGSYDYAQNWSRGKVVVVKINPKDVVSVPSDYNCQKLRCCAYTVMSEIEREIDAVATDEDGQAVEEAIYEEENAYRQKVIDKVQKYINNKRAQNVKIITLRSIQSSFSPDCPSILEIIDAIHALGLKWRNTIGKGKIVDL
jgi:hypothetical protein